MGLWSARKPYYLDDELVPQAELPDRDPPSPNCRLIWGMLCDAPRAHSLTQLIPYSSLVCAKARV